MMESITSLQNRKVKIWTSLQHKKGRDSHRFKNDSLQAKRFILPIMILAISALIEVTNYYFRSKGRYFGNGSYFEEA